MKEHQVEHNQALGSLFVVIGIVLIMAFVPVYLVCYTGSLLSFGRYLIDILFAPFLALYGGVVETGFLIRFGLSVLGLLLAIVGVILHSSNQPIIRLFINLVLLFGFMFLLFSAYFAVDLWLCG